MKDKLKVAFLCQYPIYTLNIENISDSFNNEHSTPWIINLLLSLQSNYPNIEIHVVTESTKVRKIVKLVKNGIYFHITRSGSAIPFTKFNYPSFIPVDKLFLYYINSHRLIHVLNNIKPDLVHAHGTEFSYAISANRSGYKTIISVQGLINCIFKDSHRLFFFLSKYIERIALKGGKYFIPKSNFTKDYVLKLNPYAIFFDIENIIGEDFFKSSIVSVTSKQIIFVGSLQKYKGIEDLLIAYSKLRNGRLIVIGATTETELRNRWIIISRIIRKNKITYFQYLKNLTKELNISERVEFLGKQSAKTIADELSKSRVLVLPSYMENSPNVIMEALVIGIPVIAYNVGGIPELVRNDFNGYLVEPGDIEMLANRIQKIIDNNDLFERLSLNAKLSVQNKFGSATVAKKTYEAYLHILNN